MKQLVHKNGKVFCVLVDDRKAFDKVLHRVMLAKQLNKLVPIVFIRPVAYLVLNPLSCSVFVEVMCWVLCSICIRSVSYTHLTLPTNREV